MNDPSPYWGDRSYIPVAVPKVNDKMFYTSDHSAVVVDASRRIVRSKWGAGCLVEHVETYCPYWKSGVAKTYYMRSYL